MQAVKQYEKKDAELFAAVRKLQQGDDTGVNKVYELSERYIYKIINDIVKNHQTTEDLMQETYIQVYNKINTLASPEAFYVWAGRIATNMTLRYIQKNRREVLAAADEEGSTDFIFERAAEDNQEAFLPENILDSKETQRLIGEILDKLSIEQKLSVQYFYYEEMSASEIAEAMGCSTGTVKSRLNYARKSIKDAVIDLDVKEGTRLYSMASMPVFLLVFRAGVEQLILGAAVGAAGAAGVAQGIGTATAGGAATAGSAGTASAAGAAGAGAASAAGAAGAGATGAGTTGATGAGATGKVAAIATKVLGTTAGKVAAVGVAAVVTVGGGVAIHNATSKPAAENYMSITLNVDYDEYAENYLDTNNADRENVTIVEGGKQVLSTSGTYTDSEGYSVWLDHPSEELLELTKQYLDADWADQYYEEDKEVALQSEEYFYNPIDVTDKFPKEIEFTLAGEHYKFAVEKVTYSVRSLEWWHYEDEGESIDGVYPPNKFIKMEKNEEGEDRWVYKLVYGYSIYLKGTYTCDGDIKESPYAFDEENWTHVNQEAFEEAARQDVVEPGNSAPDLTPEEATEEEALPEVERTEVPELNEICGTIYNAILAEDDNTIRACIEENGDALLAAMSNGMIGYDKEKCFSFYDMYDPAATGYDGMIGYCTTKSSYSRFEFYVGDYSGGYADGKGVCYSISYYPAEEEKLGKQSYFYYLTMADGFMTSNITENIYRQGQFNRTEKIEKVSEGEIGYRITITNAAGSTLKMNMNTAGQLIFDENVVDLREAEAISYTQKQEKVVAPYSGKAIVYNYYTDSVSECLCLALDGEEIMNIMADGVDRAPWTDFMFYTSANEFEPFGGYVNK